MSVDEAFERVRAMIADRSASELDRKALELLIRVATRGRHLSSTRMPAVTTATQHFVKAREQLEAGLGEIEASSFQATELDEPPEEE